MAASASSSFQQLEKQKPLLATFGTRPQKPAPNSPGLDFFALFIAGLGCLRCRNVLNKALLSTIKSFLSPNEISILFRLFLTTSRYFLTPFRYEIFLVYLLLSFRAKFKLTLGIWCSKIEILLYDIKLFLIFQGHFFLDIPQESSDLASLSSFDQRQVKESQKTPQRWL